MSEEWGQERSVNMESCDRREEEKMDSAFSSFKFQCRFQQVSKDVEYVTMGNMGKCIVFQNNTRYL